MLPPKLDIEVALHLRESPYFKGLSAELPSSDRFRQRTTREWRRRDPLGLAGKVSAVAGTLRLDIRFSHHLAALILFGDYDRIRKVAHDLHPGEVGCGCSESGIGMKEPRGFELLVEPSGSDAYGVRLLETNGSGATAPIRLTHLPPLRVQRVTRIFSAR